MCGSLNDTQVLVGITRPGAHVYDMWRMHISTGRGEVVTQNPGKLPLMFTFCPLCLFPVLCASTAYTAQDCIFSYGDPRVAIWSLVSFPDVGLQRLPGYCVGDKENSICTRTRA